MNQYDDFIQKNLDKLLIPIDELELRTRTTNCLKNLGIKDVGGLIQCSEKDLLKSPNFGRTSLNELKIVVEENLGLKFDTQIVWPPENYEQLKKETKKIEPMKIQADQKSVMDKIKSVLKENEALVVNKRFWEGNTLEEIGQMRKVTRERIRQIEAKAMRKTKNLCKNYLAKFLEEEKDQIFSKFSASEDLVTSKSLSLALKLKFPLSEYDGLVMFSIEIMHKKIENFFNEKFNPLLGGWYKKQNVDELNNDVEEIIYHLDKKPLPRQCESARVIANVSKENFKNCALIIDSERNYYLIENYFCSRYQKKWGLNSNFYLSRVHYIAFKKSPNKYITYDELLPLVCNDPLLKHTAWAKGKLRMKDMIRGKGLINTEHLFIITGRGIIPIGKYENYFEGFNKQKEITSENHQDKDLENNLDIPLEQKQNFNIADILKIISNILHKHKVLSVKELSKIYVKKLKKKIIPEQAVRILNVLLSGYANYSLVAPGLWSLSEEKVTGSDLLEFHKKYDDVYGVDMYCLFRMADEGINSFSAWSYDYEKELCIQGKNKFPKKTYDSLIHISNPRDWNADKKTIDEHLELKKNSIFHINIDYRGSYNISKNKKSITSYELDKVGRAILYLAENEKICAVSLNIFLEKPIYWNSAYSSLGMLSFAGIIEPPENKLKSYGQNKDLVLELKEMVIDELIEFGRLSWTKKFGKRIVEMVQNNYDAFVQKENWITENLRFHGKL